MPQNKFHKNRLKTEKNHNKFSSQINVQNYHTNGHEQSPYLTFCFHSAAENLRRCRRDQTQDLYDEIIEQRRRGGHINNLGFGDQAQKNHFVYIIFLDILDKIWKDQEISWEIVES